MTNSEYNGAVLFPNKFSESGDAGLTGGRNILKAEGLPRKLTRLSQMEDSQSRLPA